MIITLIIFIDINDFVDQFTMNLVLLCGRVLSVNIYYNKNGPDIITRHSLDSYDDGNVEIKSLLKKNSIVIGNVFQTTV